MTHIKRRNLVKAASISALSCFLPFVSKAGALAETAAPVSDGDNIYLINSGILYKPAAYIQQLQLIQQQTPITRDFYADAAQTIFNKRLIP